MISVLVVEDSPVARDLIVHILSGPKMKVIGTAADGEEAVQMVARLRPDVVTMDIVMPKLGGIEATRTIMETTPVPIVIVSGNWDQNEVKTTFRAMKAGALAVVRRPAGIGHPEYERLADELRRTVRLMSEVKVVRRWLQREESSSTTPVNPTCPPFCNIRIVAIGASAGGPPVLQQILAALPATFTAPVVIVQHLSVGFLPGMIRWLSESSQLPLHIATEGERLLPGHVYFAPDNVHAGITGCGTISLTAGEAEHGARPSVSHLFRSVAAWCGKDAVAVILTGMGRDGADGMKQLLEKGGITIAQDRATSVVYGMPAAAVAMGAAMYELPADRIAALLQKLALKEI